jgi:hypothetical protein
MPYPYALPARQRYYTPIDKFIGALPFEGPDANAKKAVLLDNAWLLNVRWPAQLVFNNEWMLIYVRRQNPAAKLAPEDRDVIVHGVLDHGLGRYPSGMDLTPAGFKERHRPYSPGNHRLRTVTAFPDDQQEARALLEAFIAHAAMPVWSSNVEAELSKRFSGKVRLILKTAEGNPDFRAALTNAFDAARQQTQPAIERKGQCPLVVNLTFGMLGDAILREEFSLPDNMYGEQDIIARAVQSVDPIARETVNKAIVTVTGERFTL